jgi:23S rRNA (adenine2503-C2)-methyltransferase
MESLHFYDLTLKDLEAALVGQGKQKFRAQQLFKWIYGQRQSDFSKMTNLSKAFQTEMRQLLDLSLPPVVTEHISTDGTRKYLFDVGDAQMVEAVLIPSEDRLTLCLSSEIGCNMACQFCYTGKQKLKRRLRAGEIVGQFLQVTDRLPESQRITNIVFMGMGEPLDNPEEVFKSIEIFQADWGLNLSRKRITVSTSGIVPMIPKVSEAGVRLAVSLNGVNNEVRSKVMPINKKWPLEVLLDACREYCEETKDKVTFEYVLLKGVTDSLEDARALHKIAQSVPSKVNIIPFNEHPGSGFFRPDEKTINAFHQELMKLGTHVLRRKTMGRDIYAACGQLATSVKNHPQQLQA